MPSLELHLGFDSLSDGLKIPGTYTLDVLGKSLEETKANLIVELDDVQSVVSNTSSDSSKSHGIFYLRESTVDPDKVPYKLHVEDVGYFSDYSDYSKTNEDFETPVSKNSLV